MRHKLSEKKNYEQQIKEEQFCAKIVNPKKK